MKVTLAAWKQCEIKYVQNFPFEVVIFTFGDLQVARQGSNIQPGWEVDESAMYQEVGESQPGIRK